MYEVNNIYNVDCYKAIKDIPDKSIDCIYTDVPYLIEDGGCSDTELSKRAYRLRNVDLKDIKSGIDYSILEDMFRVMKKTNIFIWCNSNQMYYIWDYWHNKAQLINKRINVEVLIWCKNNPTPLTNNVWLPDIEYCLYFREGGGTLE